jgi:tRNA nucleotidyltransferase (CCA-adding enzyme)
LNAIVQHAEQQGAPIYLVGGCIRDLLLERPNLDLDLVLEGDAFQLGRALVNRFGGRLVVHKTFGTAVWWLPAEQSAVLRELHFTTKKEKQLPEFFDLITARRESYPRPAALPSVRFATIREDQYRRDFTINTMAIRLDGSEAGLLLDPWGGLKDLRAGILRTLHSESFSDDPTRILRILRLAGRLGFKIDPGTRRQLLTNLPVLEQVSGERIRTEFELTLIEKERISILRSMQKLGILRVIHPKLKFSSQSAQRFSVRYEKEIPSFWDVEELPKSDLGFVLWLMNFSPQNISGIAERLSFRADLREAILAAARLRRIRAKLLKLPVSDLVELLENVPKLSVYALFVSEHNSLLAKRLTLFARKWGKIHPRANGNTLRKLGLKPGPSFKVILNRLRAAWLDGEVRSARQEQKLLRALLDEYR